MQLDIQESDKEISFNFETLVWIMERKEPIATIAPPGYQFWDYYPWKVIFTFISRA